MKLHLPKQLFTALLAAITLATPAAWGAWGTGDGTNTNVYYTDSTTIEIDTLSTSDEGAGSATSKFLHASSANTSGTITTLTLQNGETLTIAGDESSADANFESLTIGTLNINPAAGATGNGSASLVIGASQTTNAVYPTQNVTLNAINGTLSALSIDNNATLTLSKNIVTANGKITKLDLKQGGTLDLSGVTSVGIGGEAANYTYLMNRISGAGTVKLAQGLVLQTTNSSQLDVSLSAHYTVAGADVADYSSTTGNSDTADLTLQSWAKGKDQWRSWNVGSSGSLTVGTNGKGVLNVLSGNRLNITGGTVTAGIIRIGHSGASDNVGAIALTDDGQLTVGNILVQGKLTTGWDNLVELLDGTVEFTSAYAITYATNIAADVVLGGSGEEMLKLVANTDWGISKHTHANSSFTIGNITVDEANTGKITLTGATVAGNIKNNADLSLSGFTVAADTEASISGTGTTTLSGTVTNNGALSMSSFTVAADTEATFGGTGTTTLSGTVTNNGTLNMSGFSVAADTEATISGTGTLSGTVTNAGTLNLAGFTVAADTTASISGTGTTNLSGTITNNGTLNLAGFTVAAGAEAILEGTGTTTLDSTVTNNGTLNLNGVLNISSLAGLEQSGSYSAGSNGIFTGIFSVVTSGAEGELNLGEAFDLQLNGSALSSTSTNATTYYTYDSKTGSIVINETGTQTYWINTNASYDASNEEMLNAESFIVAAGAEFYLTDASVLSKTLIPTDTSKVYFRASGSETNLLRFTGESGGEGLDLSAENATVTMNTATAYAGSIRVLNGTTFNINGQQYGGHIVLEGGATLGNTGSGMATGAHVLPTLELAGNATVSPTNQLVMNSTSGSAGELDLNGYTLTKTGNGKLYLNNLAITSGTLQINAGTVETGNAVTVGSGEALNVIVNQSAILHTNSSYSLGSLTLSNANEICVASGTITVTGETNVTGTFKKTGSGTLKLQGATTLGGIVETTSGSTLEVSGALTARDDISKKGNGTLYLKSGIGEQKIKNLTITGGTVRTDQQDTLAYSSETTMSVQNATLDLDARQTVDSSNSFELNSGTISGDGGANNMMNNVNVGLEVHNGSTLLISSEGTSSITTNIGFRNAAGKVEYTVTNGTLTNSGIIASHNNGTTGAVVKKGAGELILSGANTYANGTTVEAGTLTVNTANALGTGSVLLKTGSILTLGATVTNAIAVDVQEGETKNWAEIKLSNNAGLDHSTSVTTNNDTKVAYTVNSGSTLTISGTANTSNIERLNVAGGKVKLSAWNASLGSSEDAVDMTLSNDGMFSFANGNSNSDGGKMYLNVEVDGSGKLAGSFNGGYSNIIGTITSNGDNAHDTLKLGMDDNNNWWTISATIKDHDNGADKLAVQKVDDVNVVLSGTNTYTGGTMIDAGELRTQNTSALGTGAVQLNGSGVLRAFDALTISELNSTSATTVVTTGTGAATLTVSAGEFAGALKDFVAHSNFNGVADGAHALSLVKTDSGTLTLSGANTYTGGTMIEAGTVTTQNASALGSGGVEMTGGELVVSNVDNSDTDLTVGGAIVMNAAATAKLATSGTTLSLGTAGSVKKSNADDSQHVTIASDGTNAASMTAKADNAQLVQLQEDASFTIQDMTLTNTTITAATVETKVKLQNVTASNVVLAQGKFSTDAPMSVVGAGGTAFSASTSAITEGSSITIKASEGASLAVDLGDLSCVTEMGPGKYDLSITLSGVKLDSYTDLEVGAGITFEGWLGELIGASSGVQVRFSEAVAEETPAAAAEGGAATGVTYSTGSVGTVINIYGLNVPEPATSTLSLLALAALAARRRRND